MSRISVLVYRQEKCEVGAAVVVSARQSKRVRDSASLLDRLRKAITRWMCETKKGKEAWEDSGADFNIGDLSASHMDDKGPDESLVPYLEAQGVCDLDVDQLDPDADWTYDTVLCDEEKVREVLEPDQ
jgi:hypothetical protein